MEQNSINHNGNSNGNGNKFKVQEKPTIQLLTCTECGYTGLEVKDKFCSVCHQPFSQGQSIDRLSPKDATLEKNRKLRKFRKRGKKSQKNSRLPYIISLTTVIAVGAIGIVGLKLNSNPYGHLKTAQGTISFGGEPCAQRLVNLIVNSEVFNSSQKKIDLNQGIVKDFVDYLVSEKGQKIVSGAGFVPKYLSNR